MMMRSVIGSRLTRKMTFSYLNSRTAFDESSNLMECSPREGLEQKKSGFLVENFEKSTSVARPVLFSNHFLGDLVFLAEM